MKIIDKSLLDKTTEKATKSTRLRMNHNFHASEDAPINRLLNAMEPDTYIRPHRHLNPGKEEIFLLLRGKAVLFVFDENGNITNQLMLSPDEGVYGAELEPGVWHSLLVLESGTVVYEVKEGPFIPLNTADLASWSPDATDKESVRKYMDFLRKSIK
jgi:cupin fold WbuC family metalloprotein